MDAIDAQMRLAIYGTLAPGRPNHHQLSALQGEWRPGELRGRLEAKGLGAAAGYPGLVLDSQGEDIEVQLFECPDLPLHWGRLDAFERDGYRRATARVETATDAVEPCIYISRVTRPCLNPPRADFRTASGPAQ